MTQILTIRRLLGLAVALFLLCQVILAQSPNAIPYQAVARNSSGSLLQNQPVRVRFSIHEGTASGVVVYQETHTATTNNLGLFSVNIGQGSPVSGTFSGINWGSGLKFTQVELDPSGGTAYLDMGTVQMLSVPYALYAASSGSAANEGDPQVSSSTTNAVPKWNGTTLTDGLLYDNGTNVGIGTAAPSQKLEIVGTVKTVGFQMPTGATGGYILQTDANGNALWVAPSNVFTDTDDQLLSLSGATLSIDGGNSVDLSPAFPNQWATNVNNIYNNNPGHVGIGTTNPEFKLDVQNGSNLAVAVRSSSNIGTWLRVQNSSSGGQLWDLISTGNGNGEGAGNFLFKDNSGAKMILLGTSGNVGIGTTAPSQKLEVAGTVKTVGFQMPTGATGGYVLQTDANGNASWVNATSLSITETDPQVGSSSTNYVPKWNGTSLTDGSIFDNGTNVGIGTANPLSKLHTNNGNFLVTGAYDSGNDIEVSGTGTRMFFTPKTAAFRAGYSISDRWNPANLGDFSAAFGIGTKASGSAAFAIGDAASATGTSAFAGGYNTMASGDRSMAFGQSSTASANHSFAMGNYAVSSANNALSIGNNTTASGDASVALGYYAVASGAHAFATNGYTTAKSFSEAAFGQYNTDYTPNSTTAWNTNDRLFVIGNGTSSANLSNAFTMLKSGNIGIGTDLPSQKLEVNGTTKTTNFQMTNGATNGYILQSDASGNASWAAPSSVFSDTDDQTLSLAGTTLSIDGGNSVDISQKTLADADTKIQVEESTDEDKIRFDLGGTERWVMTGSRLEPSNSGSSLFLGYNAGASDDLAFNNNVALGFSALSSSVSGNNCVGIGYASLNGNTASRNTAIGSFSLYTNTTGSGNSVLGYLALTNNSGGSNNVAIGQSAGFSTLGSGNTFLGYEAGYNETGSNKLYIDNSSTSSPLIWGDFSSNYVNINGNLGIGTTSPEFKLDVVSSDNLTMAARGSNTSGTWFRLQNTSTGGQLWDFISTGSTNGEGAGNLIIKDNSGVKMTLLGTSGNVGIGTTSPSQKLDVNGKTRTTNFQMTNGATNGYILQSDASGNASWVAPTSLSSETDPQVSSSTTGRVPRWTGTELSDGTMFDNGTNVGIGTTAPVNKLDVEGGIAVGSTYAGTSTSPTNGAIIEGNVGIGTTSPSQKLDVSGTTKTTNFQLTNGATSGYVLKSDASGNASWVNPTSLTTAAQTKIQDADANTKIQVEETSNENIIRFDLAGTEQWVMTGSRLEPANSGNSVFIGTGAGSSDDLTDNKNVAIGYGALQGNTTGANLTAIGGKALLNNTTGNSNTAIGRGALQSNLTGSYNTTLGEGAGASITSGNTNTFIGYNAGTNTTGNGNVFIGYNAGANETGSNKLYIANSHDSSPLIYGDFNGNHITINGNLGIGTTSLPNKMDLAGNIAIGSSYGGGAFAPTNGAIIEGNVGIGTTSPDNKLDVEGAVAIGGSYSGSVTAPSNGAIIEGNVGIGTSSPAAKLDVNGSVIIDRSGTNVGTTANGVLRFGGGTSGEAIASCRSSAGNQYGLDFYTNDLVQMSITTEGNVGIGTTTPTQALLVVDGYESTNIGGFGYLNDNGNAGTSSGTHNYSIYANARVAASEFNAHSDARIKHIKGLSNNATDLQTLMGIEITDYTLRDTVSKGNKSYKKVIAQQVEQVYPQAVSTIPGVAVPDIYRLSNMENGFVALPNSGIKVGARVKLIFGEKQTIAEVMAVSEKGFQTNLTTEHGQVFVYGREVSDFRTVDYEALSMLNVSATQALVKEISDLKKQNAQLHGQMQDLNQWREKVEAMLQTRPHK